MRFDGKCRSKSAGKHYVQLGAYRSKASAETRLVAGKRPFSRAQLKSLHPHYANGDGRKYQVGGPPAGRAATLAAAGARSVRRIEKAIASLHNDKLIGNQLWIRTVSGRTVSRSRSILVAGLGVALLCAGVAASAAFDAPAATDTAPMSFTDAGAAIQTRTLANGLQVIVWPDHRIPSVALYNWVRVGSRKRRIRGPPVWRISSSAYDVQRHRKRRTQGEFNRLLEGSGGSDNAYTTQDVTVYHETFPRSALELVFDLESDRLARLAFEPKVVESEREVVYSERRLRIEDSNPAFLAEQVQATAFIAHPYRIPTVGWPSDIKAWTLTDLQNFYHTWYAPNNCTLVVVGDVEPAQVFALADKYYGPIARGPTTPTVRTVEPEQSGVRRVTIERRAQNPLLQVAWHAVSADDSAGARVELAADHTH